jgi:hypothetical protein
MSNVRRQVATLEVFAEITRTVIASGGFADFLPTVLYPQRKQVMALEGVPRDADVDAIAVAWAADGAIGEEEFLVAFKISEHEFKIVRRLAGEFEVGVFNAESNASPS